MRTLILAATLFAGLAGCTTTEPTDAPATEQDTTQSVEEVPASLLPEATPNTGICPSQWTCDDVHWFATSAACAASSACAGSTCFRDSHCTAGCICP